MGKRVLITGEHSYLGTSLENYVKRYYPDWSIKCVSVHGTEWKKLNFGVYDTIFHAAGKAHADVGKVTGKVRREYYKVNRDLAQKVAEKARRDGTRQFIYPSSIIIYGENASVGQKRKITADTKPAPSNFYGDSKFQGDLLVQKLSDETFHTAVVRLPMVYGKGSRGNYPLLVKLAKKIPVFPKVKNKRSMIYVENLCQFLCELIENQEAGIFYPQNPEYVSTSEMVKLIAEKSGKKIYLLPFSEPFIKIAGRIPGKIGRLTGKAFGTLVYDKQMSSYHGNSYQKYNLEESIARIEEQKI